MVLDKQYKQKISARATTIIDRVALTLAEYAAGVLPDANVYIGPVRQNVQLPAVFIRFYETVNVQMLDDVSAYDFGFDIAYFPKNELSDGELNHAMFALQQGLYEIQSEFGAMYCYRKNGSITDRVAHVTGQIRVMEQTIPDDPIIEIADKELKI